MSVVSISLANAEQRDACYQLIYDVFCTEMGIMRGDADHQRGIVRDEGVDVSLVFHAELDGELAGTMGIISETLAAPRFRSTSSRNSRFRAFCPQSRATRWRLTSAFW